MLHSVAAQIVRDMIDKQIGIKGPIIHPPGSSRYYASDKGNDLPHIVVGRLGVNHYPIVSTALLEICLLERTDLHWSIHQLIVAVRRKRVRAQTGTRGSDPPTGRNILEA